MRSALILLGLVSLAPAAAQAPESADRAAPGRVVHLAVIVHGTNPVSDLTLGELRTYLKLERQFWPNRRRCVLYLRPSGSVESEILLDRVYRMDHQRLQKYWVTKLFSGEIPAKPSYVPTAQAAISRVQDAEGAVSVVLLKEIPEELLRPPEGEKREGPPSLRVLAVDGKKPGEEGYPLTVIVPAKPGDES